MTTRPAKAKKRTNENPKDDAERLARRFATKYENKPCNAWSDLKFGYVEGYLAGRRAAKGANR